MNIARNIRTASIVAAPGVAVLAISLAVYARPGPVHVDVMAATKAQSGQVQAVQNAFTAAMGAMLSAGSPPAAQAQTAMRAHSLKGVYSGTTNASQRSLLLASGRASLKRYFSAKQEKNAERSLLGMLAEDADPNQVNMGAGVESVHFLSVVVDSSATATVQADVTAWARSLARTDANAPWIETSPRNTMRFAGKLVRQSGGDWQIDSLVGDFVPGSAP